MCNGQNGQSGQNGQNGQSGHTVSLFNGGQHVSLTTDVIFAWFR